MSQDTLMLYKLMVLYMLNKVDFPLTNSQISEFILDKGYTNYFTLQQALHDLSDTELIRTEHIHNNSYYSMNQSGEETLEFFGYKIPAEIKTEIDQFFNDFFQFVLAVFSILRHLDQIFLGFLNHLSRFNIFPGNKFIERYSEDFTQRHINRNIRQTDARFP